MNVPSKILEKKFIFMVWGILDPTDSNVIGVSSFKSHLWHVHFSL